VISGSQGLAACVDNILIMRRERYTQNATLSVTGRDIDKEQVFGMSWNEEAKRWEITSSGREAFLSAEMQRVLAAVKEHQPIGSRDLAAVLFPGTAIVRDSKEWKHACRYLAKLADAGLVEKDGATYRVGSKRSH